MGCQSQFHTAIFYILMIEMQHSHCALSNPDGADPHQQNPKYQTLQQHLCYHILFPPSFRVSLDLLLFYQIPVLTSNQILRICDGGS